jgi:hypothetical protein
MIGSDLCCCQLPHMPWGSPLWNRLENFAYIISSQHYLLREQIKGSCYITINGELGQCSSECQIIMYLWSTLIWKDPMRASIFFLLFILLPISKLVESYVKVEKLGKIWDKIQETHKKFSADP